MTKPPDHGQPFAMLIFGVLIGAMGVIGLWQLDDATQKKKERER